MSWDDVATVLPLIVADLACQGIHLDVDALAGRSWEWLRARIFAVLLDPRSRAVAALTHTEEGPA